MIPIHPALKRTVLSIAVATSLVACGGDDNSDNDYLDDEVNTEITVTEGHSQQDLPVAPEDEVKIATYAMTHDLSYSEKLVNDYMIEGNIINLPNTNYQVGDTIEFEDTIIKIDSIVDNGQYAIVPAGLFDVFSELEINTSMVMESNNQHQLGSNMQYNTDLLKSARNLYAKYNAIDEAGCLPKGRNDVTVHGAVNKHHYRNTHYNGVQLALENCKLYETENGSITTDQSVNVGMRASRIYISSHEKSLKFYVDGASLLAGNLNINFDSKGKRVRSKTRLATYKPTIIKGLEASKVDSLAHLLNTEIYLDLENSIKGEFKGSTRIQVPADFAIGMDASFDETANEWKFNSYNLTDNKTVAIDKQALGVGYNVEVMNLELGSAISAGYKFKINASSPWFKENDQPNSLQIMIQEIKDANKALFTGDVAVNSFGKASAGFMLDTTAGSQVDIEDCKANLKGVTGLYSYNSFLARAGSGLIMANAPTINRNIFTDPMVLFRLNLFDSDKLKREDWCGPLSKLKGEVGGNGSRVFVSDANGKVIYDVKYIQDWSGNSSTQAGLFQVGATISETDQLWQDLQNFATPTEVVQEFVLPTEVPEGLLNLSFEDDSTKYSMDDEGWVFAWKTFNPGITINNDRSRTPGFAIDCEGNCTDDPILLVVQTPDKKYAYLQFKPTFADALTVDATAKATQSDLTLSAEANYSGATYTWESSDGKVLITQKPELTVPSTSEFATQVLIDGKVRLITEALGQNSTIDVNVESEELSEVEKAVNTMVGYWNSDCINTNYGSKEYYLNFSKFSSNKLNIDANLKQVYSSSGCTGTSTISNNWEDEDSESITLNEQELPNFVGKDKFIIDENGMNVGYSRIPKGEFEGILSLVEDNSSNSDIVTETGGNDRDALTSPNGGEHWFNGSTETIRWMMQYITGSNVDLYVLHDNPAGLINNTDQDVGKVINSKIWYKFASSVPNTGSYTLDPEIMGGTGNAYMVLVVSTSNKAKFDISDNRFSLNE